VVEDLPHSDMNFGKIRNLAQKSSMRMKAPGETLASSGDSQEAGIGQAMLTRLGGKEFAKKMKLPKQCKEDYDCNEGGYNWPLRCMDFVFAKICVDPDDSPGGGLGALNWDERDLVPEPIPVRVEDGWLNHM